MNYGQIQPVAVVVQELDNDGQGWCSKVRWLYNPVPVGEELLWDHKGCFIPPYDPDMPIKMQKITDDGKAIIRLMQSSLLLDEAVGLMREFVRRVEAGEVRSKKTYISFKVLLAKYDEEREHASKSER